MSGFRGDALDLTDAEDFVENRQARRKNHTKINANDEVYALAA